MLIVTGGLLASYLIWRDGLVPALPSALIGLALVAFGWSMVTRERRERRNKP